MTRQRYNREIALYEFLGKFFLEREKSHMGSRIATVV